MNQIPSAPSAPPRRNSSAAVIAGIAGTLLLIYWLRIVLLPFVFAAAIAFIATPLITWFDRRMRLPRWLAAVAVFIFLLGVLAAIALWARHVLVPEVIDFSHSLPKRMGQLLTQLTDSDHIRFFGREVSANDLSQSMLASLQAWMGGPFAAISGALLTIAMAFLTLVLLFFFLMSGPRLLSGMVWLIPPAARPMARSIAAQIVPILRRYIIGVIVVVLITSVLSWIGIGLLLGLPQAVMLSIVIGCLEAIPVVGPIVSAALLALVAVTRGGTGMIIGVGLFALSIRLFIDNLLGPIILGQATRLHPVVVIFAFLVGGTLFGVLGLLLAVPTARIIVVVLENVYGETPACANLSGK